MKTTTKRLNMVPLSGTTRRFDENGKELYTIWADGVVWIGDPMVQGNMNFYINRTGKLFQFDKNRKAWVETPYHI